MESVWKALKGNVKAVDASACAMHDIVIENEIQGAWK